MYNASVRLPPRAPCSQDEPPAVFNVRVFRDENGPGRMEVGIPGKVESRSWRATGSDPGPGELQGLTLVLESHRG